MAPFGTEKHVFWWSRQKGKSNMDSVWTNWRFLGHQNDIWKFQKVSKILTQNSVKNTGNFAPLLCFVRYPIWFNTMFEFCQKMSHSIFDSILIRSRFSSKYYSTQKILLIQLKKIIQFNNQGIIDTGQIKKVPKNCPKRIIQYHFSRNTQLKKLFNKLFPGNVQSKIWIWLYSIH